MRNSDKTIDGKRVEAKMEEVQMKRILSLILCTVLILGLTGCQKTEKNPFAMSGDFRNAAWGMTKDEVEAVETAELIVDKDDLVIYRDQVGRYADVDTGYSFVGNKLTKGTYMFSENHDEKSSPIEDFYQIKEELGAIYGKPTMEGSDWLNERKYNVPEDQLVAMVAKGDLVYFSRWSTDTTEVDFGLYGKNGEINMILSYASKEFAALEDSYKADTTGYQSARAYQDYLDHPGVYEDEFIYVTGEVWDLSFNDTILLKDKDGHIWVAMMTYPVSNTEIIQEGDEVTLFGRVAGQFETLNAVALMLFKVDKEGEVLHVKEPGGKTFERVFFSWKAAQ